MHQATHSARATFCHQLIMSSFSRMAMRRRVQVRRESALQLVGDPVLTQVSREVAEGETLPPSLLRNMQKHLASQKGAAISAVQVGEPIRAVMVANIANGSAPPRLIINPRVIRQSKQRAIEWESCLSVPNYAGLVARPRRIVAAYETAEGSTIERILTGCAA